jgi:hypothetical protein
MGTNRNTCVRNMNEKFGWMRRSKDRMQEQKEDPLNVQDHFWSYVHASQLIWNYFGSYCYSHGLPKGQPGILVNAWKDEFPADKNSLREAWKILNSLRNEDVHVEPVETIQTERAEFVTHHGEPVTYQGELVTHGDYKYKVVHDSVEYDVWELTAEGIEVMGLFIAEFSDGKIVAI